MKRQKILWMRWLLGLTVLSFLLSGCAAGTSTGTSQAPAPSRMEDLLVQAGFKVFPENSPKCQKICQKLPPGQLVPHKKGDKTIYAYVSPETKRLYGGDEAAYQRFIDLAVMQKIEERQRPVSTPSSDPEFWTMWSDMHGGG